MKLSGVSPNAPGSTLSRDRGSWLLVLSKVCGFFGLAVGVIVTFGWYAHWIFMIEPLPDVASMKYNTALGFVVCSAGLLLLGTPRAWLTGWLGRGLSLLGLLTVTEYLFHQNLGMDQVLARDYLLAGTAFPGRMSPLTASCFTLLGLALALAARQPRSKESLTAVAMLSCIAWTISGMALFGYVFGIQFAYSWGAYTRMAMPTAVTFLMLSTGLITWTRHSAHLLATNFLRWLPVMGSLTLLAMIAAIFVASLDQLRQASSYREHSYEVLTQAQLLGSNIIDTQRGMRSYVLTGQAASLVIYQTGVSAAQKNLAQLHALTQDDPEQQACLKKTDEDFERLVTYARNLIDTHNKQGLPAALKIEATGEGFNLIDDVSADLHTFINAEQSLLKQRAMTALADFDRSTRLLIFSSAIAAALIIVANLVTNLEISRRSRSEAQLRETSAVHKAILNSTNYAVVSCAHDGIVTSFNSTAENWLGYTAEEIIGKTSPAIWHDPEEIAERARVLSQELGRKIEPGFEAFIAKVAEGQTDKTECTFIRKDGSRFPVSLTVAQLTDEAGIAVGYFGVMSDLTERSKAKQELKKSAERLNAVVNNSLDGIITYDAVRDQAGKLIDLRFTTVNPAAEKLLRQNASDLVEKNLLETFPLIASSDLWKKFTQIIEENATLDFEHPALYGEVPRWYRIAGTRLGDGLVVSYSEITARKEAENQLSNLAQRLSLATQAIQAGVWDWDVRSNALVWDKKMYELYDLPENEPMNYQIWAQTVVPEDFPAREAILQKAIATKSQGSAEFRIKLPNGSIRHIQAAEEVVLDGAGEVAHVVGVNIDITARKQSEEALRLSEERFSNAFEYATIGMSLVSPDGHWLKVNQALCNIVGYTMEELSGKTFQDITHPEDLAGDLANARLLLDRQIPSYKMEKRYFHKQGHLVWVLLGVSLVRDEHGQPLYFISQIEDITASKEALAQQKELTEKAQAAERAKSEFLAIMSHEIRTPMNGVIGMTSILADTELTDMQRDCVNTITTSGETLLAVINDILDYSKIESHKMELENKSFNLRQCVEGVFDLFTAQIRLKNLEVAYLVTPQLPVHLVGDMLRLRQILVNLIGNAIKFTADGNILVNVQGHPLENDEVHLLFSISDTGIGIPEESLPQLFHAFQQVDTSTSRRFGGTGLGLVISKRIAELMGGTMWVESEVGQGSTFFFTAVMKASSAPGGQELESKSNLLKSRSVLLVDDNTTHRYILETQLKNWGMLLTSLSSSPEAVQKLVEQPFDVVLIDSQKREQDGVTLAQQMRKVSPTPLILVSSAAEILTSEESKIFAFQILKPIKHSQLLNALLQVMGIAASPEKAPESKMDHHLGETHPLRILLAEDNLVNQKVALIMLSRLGYQADLAPNGLRAVETAEKNPYDLILMDIQMPEMNGIEATARIRQKLGQHAPRIIALTAEALEGDQERFLNLGFDGYLTKPLQATTLHDALKTVPPLA